MRFKRNQSCDHWIPVSFQVQKIALRVRIGIGIAERRKIGSGYFIRFYEIFTNPDRVSIT
jgi:hypothetical protein